MNTIMHNPIIDTLTFSGSRVETYFDEYGRRWYSVIDVCHALRIDDVDRSLQALRCSQTRESTYDTLCHLQLRKIEVNLEGLRALVLFSQRIFGPKAPNPFFELQED